MVACHDVRGNSCSSRSSSGGSSASGSGSARGLVVVSGVVVAVAVIPDDSSRCSSSCGRFRRCRRSRQ